MQSPNEHSSPQSDQVPALINPSTENIIDTGVNLANTVAEIVKDVGELLNTIPYVKSLSGVVVQIIKIRDEIKSNKKRCREIIDKVLDISKSIYERLAEVAQSQGKDKLTRLEDHLKDCQRTLSAVYIALEKYRSRRRIAKYINRGLDDLNALDRRVDQLNIKLILDILVDIKLEQASSATEVNKLVAPVLDHILPPKPHLLVERGGQLMIMLDILLGASPSRIAVLGGGGFGKTTLARAILHDPKIVERYKSRYFLSCEALSNADALLLGFGTMLGIKAPTSEILASARRVLATSNTLLCLDNFETPWEPSTTRTRIEEILASISDIPNLSLIITMRGTQRPSKVAWSHPLLPPLSTLSSDSAHVILQTICPNHVIDEFTQNLLDSIEGIPLAITLISNLLRDGESSRALWTRWSKEQTMLVENGGDDRESNLNMSIALSVHSPRTIKDPATISLLAALSLLPDGFPSGEIEQLETWLDINNVHKHLQTLRAVAVVNPESAKPSPRIQMLSPIRFFCLEFLPPQISLILERIVGYYISILLKARDDFDNSTLYTQVVPEIQNIHSVFQRVYKTDYSQDISSLLDATTILSDWSDYIGYLSDDTIQMALEISTNLPIPHAKSLLSLGNLLASKGLNTRAEKCFREAAEIFNRENDAANEAKALFCLGNVLRFMRQLDQAEVALEASLELYTEADYNRGQANVNYCLGNLYISQDRYSEAKMSLTSALNAYKSLSAPLGQANAAETLARMHNNLSNLVDAEEFGRESLAAAKKANYALGEANALRRLGQSYLRTDKVADARLVLEQALTIAQQKNGIINQLNVVSNLGQAYIQLDQLSIAEALLKQYAKVELDVIQIPYLLITLARVYIYGDHPDKAESHLDHALGLFQKFQRRFWQGSVLSHLGAIYLKSDDRMGDAERVLKSIPDLGTWQALEMHRLWVLGDLYVLKGRLDDAETSFNSAMDGAKLYQSSYQQGNIIRSLGTLYMKQGRVDKAISAFKQACELHRLAQWVSEQAMDLRRLGEAYEMLERSDEAKAAFEEAEALFESVREARTLKL